MLTLNLVLLVAGSSGTFMGANLFGPANYSVTLNASGWPLSAATAANSGEIRLLLPQGSYRLVPAVTPSDTLRAQTAFAPFNLEVPCGARMVASPCLDVGIDSIPCGPAEKLLISGQVRTRCTNEVKRLTYSLDGGPDVVLCEGCGLDPRFAFAVAVAPTECVPHTIRITATDINLEVASTERTFYVDQTPPRITCPQDIEVKCETTAGALVTYPTLVVSDNCPGPVSIVCSPPSGIVFPPGDTVVTCVAIDACGNRAECQFKVKVSGDCQTVPCGIKCPPDMVVDCTRPDGAIVNYPAPELTGDCPKGTRMECDPPSGSLFPLGPTIVRCKAIGPAGDLIAECKFTVTVTGNCVTTPCRLTCPADLTVECNGAGGAIVTYAAPVLSGDCPPGIHIECNPPSGSFFPLGDTIVRCVALDTAGRLVTECKFVVTVKDTTRPRITCPPDLEVVATSDAGAVVNFTVTAADDCDPALVISCSPPSGSLFPIGTTVVICRVVDASGNENKCEFKVTVRRGGEPTPLTIELCITVRWGSSGVLQSADDIAGPWTDIPGATSPYTVPLGTARRFYRVRP